MKGSKPGEERAEQARQQRDGQTGKLHADAQWTVTAQAELSRLHARLQQLNPPSASGPQPPSIQYVNQPEQLLELVHWSTGDPQLEARARALPGGLPQAMAELFERHEVDIDSLLLEFLRDPAAELRREFSDPAAHAGLPLQLILRPLQVAQAAAPLLQLSLGTVSGYIPADDLPSGLEPALQCFFDNSTEGLLLLDIGDRRTVLAANPACCAMLGLGLPELRGRNLDELLIHCPVPPGGVDGADPASRPVEMLFATAQGAAVTVSARQIEIRDAAGQLSGLALMMTDISQTRRWASSIERSETRLAIGEELAQLGSWEYEAGSARIILTDELSRIFERPLEPQTEVRELLRQLLPEDRRLLLSQYLESLRSGREISCDIRIITRSGRRRSLRVRGRQISDSSPQPRILGMAQDVTDQLRAQRIQQLLLEISEATSRTASLEELLATVHNALRRMLPASNFYVSLYNPQTELYEFPFHIDELDEDFHPQPMDGSLTDIVRREGRPMVVNRDEQQRMRTIGRIRPHGPLSMSWLGVPLSDGEDVNGVIVLQDYRSYGVYTQQDVELVSYLSGYIALAIQRRRTTDRLRESEWQYRSLVDTMFEGLSMADVEGRFVYANPALGRIMGLHPEQMVGRNIRDFLSPEMERVANRQQELRRGGSSNRYELRVQRADGQTRDLYLSVSPRYDRDGNYIGSHALVQDVTEMRQAEDAIRESEQRFRHLVEQMSEGLSSVDSEGIMEFANPALERIIGIPEGTVTGRSIFDFMDSGQQEMIRRQHELRRRGQSSTYTMTINSAEGEVRTAMISASPRFGPDGEYIGSLALVRDVTEQVRTEEILRESEERYRSLVNDISEGIFAVDPDNRFTFANPALERIMGAPRGGLQGRSLLEFLDSEQRDVVSRQDRLRHAGMSSSYRLRIRRDDGELRTCMLSANPNTAGDGSYRGSSGIVQDITEQERTLELLRANEEKFRHIYHNAPVMMYSVDSEGYIIDVNQKWLDETGYSREEVIGHRSDFLMTPESTQRMQSEIFRAYQGSGQFRDEAFSYICRDGSLIDVLIDCERSIDPAGRSISLAIVRNVTEQNAAQQQLRQVVIAVESASEAIMTTDRHGVITYVNPAFESITGYSRGEALGSTPRMLASGEMDPEFHRQLWETISRGEIWHGTFVNRRRDGSLYQEEATISPVRGPRGELVGFVAVKRDVTKQLALEEQLKQSQKMEAIGTLAGGIAHDFNNILFAIVGNSEIALDSIPPGNRAVPCVQAILEASNRATELVSQVLSYARKQEKTHAPLRLDLLVREVLKLLRASLPATVEIRQELLAGEATVLADATEIHQLLMNLCTNAWHAMLETGGMLSVGLHQAQPDAELRALHPDLDGRPCVCLSVSDTGSGIAEEHLPRIFEPFYTTKEVGKGTGMGLSVVHGIVHSLGGAISVSSRQGEGTCFRIYLPVCQEEASSDSISGPAQASGRERILLVDDEEMITHVVSGMLEALGYEVTACVGSPRAWELFSADPQAFDLVLTDQTMPQITGDELARRMLAIRPELPIVICTGYSQTLPPEAAKRLGIREYLFKPVRMHELAAALRSVLDGGQSGTGSAG